MKNLLKISVTGGCVLALAATIVMISSAQPQRGRGRGGAGGGAAVKESIKLLMTFDKNKDGKLTKVELTDKRFYRLFDSANGNKDEYLTEDELSTWVAKETGATGRGRGRGGPGTGRGGRGRGGPDAGRGGRGFGRSGFARLDPLLQALDADKDGVLSEEEISNAFKALQKLDKNNDGKLSSDELRPEFGGRRGFGRGRGGPGAGGRPGGFGRGRGRPGQGGRPGGAGRGGRGRPGASGRSGGGGDQSRPPSGGNDS